MFQKSFLTEELSTSQKQAVIKLLEIKDTGYRLIKNWRPISLLNTDVKLTSKALAKRIKKLLSSLILPNKTASLQKRFISEGAQIIKKLIKYFKLKKGDKARRSYIFLSFHFRVKTRICSLKPNKVINGLNTLEDIQHMLMILYFS